ncbi:hypothetical protein ACFFWD_14780 [Bradyrhizobium erythrophlei]|uniref:hypothetical protein n=1 Tax=Bradyrhizobium erythrophlei TaxID=1437360 RepID=UPI0035EF52E9
MPIRPLEITEMDLMRARRIERAWTPFKRFSDDDAELIVRAIAQGIAIGRKQGLELVMALNDCPARGT